MDEKKNEITFWYVFLKMFNGNETARAMRYSLTVVAIVLLARYFDAIRSDEVVLTVVTTATGYIFGKGQSGHTKG